MAPYTRAGEASGRRVVWGQNRGLAQPAPRSYGAHEI